MQIQGLCISAALLWTGSAWAQGDFNGDGVVNSLDFNILGTHFGFKALPSDLPGGAMGRLVPEPASLSILIGGMLMARRRRRIL